VVKAHFAFERNVPAAFVPDPDSVSAPCGILTEQKNEEPFHFVKVQLSGSRFLFLFRGVEVRVDGGKEAMAQIVGFKQSPNFKSVVASDTPSAARSTGQSFEVPDCRRARLRELHLVQ
jgi:hypothetical protein